jgi:hypothetical protein
VRGKSLDQVVAELKAGEILPDQIPVRCFRDPGSGKLVAIDNRTLAALSEAKVQPKYIEYPYGEVEQAVKNRLTEDPLRGDLPLPGPYVPITPGPNDVRIIRIVNLPGYPPKLR